MGSEYKTLEDFVNGIRTKGRYSFTLEEAQLGMKQSGNTLNQALIRLKNKNKIAQIRRGFYAIITPESLRELADKLDDLHKKNYK